MIDRVYQLAAEVLRKLDRIIELLDELARKERL